MEWSIAITRAGNGPVLDAHDDATVERVQRAQEELDDYAPAASIGAGSITFQVAIEEFDIEEAITAARTLTEKALLNAGLPSTWPVVEIEAVEWERFEAQLKQPTYPKLVGLAELAHLLGVTKQRASTLSRDPRFPRPHQDLASGPVWVESNVRDFAANWVRKPGRPRKVEMS